MLKKFNELSLKDKAYLIGGLSLLVIVISFGLLNLNRFSSAEMKGKRKKEHTK